MTKQARIKYVGFANAPLPNTDYRVAYARDSQICSVTLVLPARPDALGERQFVPLNVAGGLDVLSLFRLFRVPLILRRTKADVAHFFASQYVLFGPMLARLVGVRSVVTVTGLGRSVGDALSSRLLRRLVYVPLIRLSARLSEVVLFQTESDLQVIRGLLPAGLHPKLRVIGTSIDESYFADASFEEGTPSKPVSLMVARVDTIKGVDDFLTAAATLRDLSDFVLIGPRSPGNERLDQRVDRAVEDGVIRYLGRLDDAVVRSWYRAASVVVLPSRVEGIPRVLLEAAMSKRAVVAFDIPSCRAAVPAELLVREGETDAMIDRLKTLLVDEDERHAAARLAYDHVQRVYAGDGYARRLDELVSGVLARP